MEQDILRWVGLEILNQHMIYQQWLLIILILKIKFKCQLKQLINSIFILEMKHYLKIKLIILFTQLNLVLSMIGVWWKNSGTDVFLIILDVNQKKQLWFLLSHPSTLLKIERLLLKLCSKHLMLRDYRLQFKPFLLFILTIILPVIQIKLVLVVPSLIQEMELLMLSQSVMVVLLEVVLSISHLLGEILRNLSQTCWKKEVKNSQFKISLEFLKISRKNMDMSVLKEILLLNSRNMIRRKLLKVSRSQLQINILRPILGRVLLIIKNILLMLVMRDSWDPRCFSIQNS